jgi:pimeloyl-ACP methyl ester carboxylesterase
MELLEELVRLKIRMLHVNVIIVFLVTSFLTVSGIQASPGVEAPRLVSANETAHISLQTFRTFTSGFGQQRISALLKYGVKSYTIVYKTTYKGKEIEASGVIFIPEGLTTAAPLLSLQHGTTFVKEEAPSVAGMTGMELFASAGFITLMPDYIGYGKSSQIFHPYYLKDHSASTVVDMITASREFCTTKGVQFNDKVFLAGYSEGGYVTLAAAQHIEKHKTPGLSLAAVAAGAGGYDLVGMLQGVAGNSYYSYPSYLAFVLMSYNTSYDWNKDLSYFFQPAYARALTKYMNGKHDGWYINQQLTTNVKSLFNNDFYNGLSDKGKEAALKSAVVENTIGGWATKLPIRLYHGTSDEIIPLKNSETTIDSFKKAGATNITLKKIQNGNHGSSFSRMMEDFIPWFVGLADLH